MRIGIFIDDFFPASGGIGRSVQTQIEQMHSQGHEVILIAPDRFLEKPRLARVVECPTIWIRGLPAHLSVLHCSQRRAELISKAVALDIVHTQTERGALVLGARIARLQQIPHVHTFHANVAGTHQTVRAAALGTLSYQVLVNPVLTVASKRRSPVAKLPARHHETGGLQARMDWASFADIAGKVDAYTVPSPFMKELIEEASRGTVNGFVVPTGYNMRMQQAVERARRRRTDTKVRFLSVGRLAKEKRIDVLIKAFLAADLDDAELVIVGDGDQRDRLRRLAGSDPRVDFRGHLRDLDAIADELVNADILALASYRFESQGLVIVEAALAGLPVLLCDDRLTVGITQDNALLSEPDVRSMAAAMRQLCDRGRLEVMSRAATALVPELSPVKMGQRYLDVYQHAITRGVHPWQS